jgi:amidophosphoribosyltransferase
LYSLQHRGQESAGVVSIDDAGNARAVRSMGTLSDAFASELGKLHGVSAIGHTRYSTSGSSTIENAQPVVARSKGGYITLAHNGNITNAAELRHDLEEQGSIFASTSDSELIVHRLARSTAATPAERLADALTGVEGAYSLIVAIGDVLLAARDPRGWRPLAMGRLGDAVVFGSETCALDIVGATVEREVEAGEIISVNGNGIQSTHPLPAKELKRCVFEYVYFARPDSRVYGGSVDRARVQRAGLLELGRARIRRGERNPLRARPHPQSLRRTHVHSAHAGGSRRQGQGEIQPGARSARGQERRHGR